jgi:hypothetical protein
MTKFDEYRKKMRQKEKEFYHKIESRKEIIRGLADEALNRNDGAFKKLQIHDLFEQTYYAKEGVSTLNINTTKFELNRSTLLEMYEEITERIFPFITFNVVDGNGNIVSSSTVPWARFREMDDRPDLWEVRSSDEPAPKHMLYVSKSILSRYIYTSGQDNVHYVFTYYIGENAFQHLG